MATLLDTISEISATGQRLLEQGRYDEALETYQDVLKMQKVKLGNYHHDTLVTQNNISAVFLRQGKIDEALQISNMVYEAQKRSNPEHPDTLVTRNNMAAMLIDKGEYEEALRVLREVLEVSLRKRLDTLEVLQNTAIALRKLGRYEEALDCLREVYPVVEKIFGKDHPSTFILQSNMANIFSDLGEYEKARQVFEEVHTAKKRSLGLKHPSTLITRDNMAFMLSEQGKLNEALAVFEEVHRHRMEVLGPENPDTICTRIEIANILRKTGKYEKALHIYEDIKSRHNRSFSVELRDIAKELYEHGKHNEALRLYTEMCENMSDTADSREDNLKMQYNIAFILKDLERYEESLDVFIQVHEKSVNNLGPNHELTLESWESIATVLVELGKYSEALDTLRKVVERKKSIFKPEHRSVLQTKNKLAALLTLMGNYEEGLNIAKEIYQIEKRERPEHPETLRMEGIVAQCFRYSGKYDEALGMLYDMYRKSAESLGRTHPVTLKSLGYIEEMEPLMPDSNLFVPVRKNDVNKVRNLIDEGNDINIKDAFGMSPLHMATENGNIEMMKLLLEHGAPYNLKNEEGLTPLSFAADEECESLFICIARTFEAIKNENVDIVKRLVKNQFFIDVKDDSGSTALHRACDRNDEDMVKFFLSEGSDPTLWTNNGNTALLIACAQRNLNIARALVRHVKENCLDKLADFVNRKTTDKNTTSLHAAAKNGDVEIIKLLIDHGADLTAEDSEDKTPIDLAPKNLVDFFGTQYSENAFLFIDV